MTLKNNYSSCNASAGDNFTAWRGGKQMATTILVARISLVSALVITNRTTG